MGADVPQRGAPDIVLSMGTSAMLCNHQVLDYPVLNPWCLSQPVFASTVRWFSQANLHAPVTAAGLGTADSSSFAVPLRSAASG
jgi:hypothetical protein